MRFTQESSSNVNVIRAYGAHELRVNETTYHHTVIIAAAAVSTLPALARAADLGAEHAARILELQPELVLIGTGERQEFPAAAFGARFLESGIGFEVMDTGAACRTFNVLASERRRVVALLML
jgi:uncharacterized protein